MEKVRFYEGFFFEAVLVMLKDKEKYIIKDTLSMKISFMHYLKWIRVILQEVFEEFELVCTLLPFFSCHYHCQLVKCLANMRGPAAPPAHPPVSTGL